MSCQACKSPPTAADLGIGEICENRMRSCCQKRPDSYPGEIQNVLNECQQSTEESELPCPPYLPCRSCPPSCEEELREAMKHYDQLQVDFKGKVTDIGVMRIALEKLKEMKEDVEDAKKTAEAKAEELERLLKEFDDKFGGAEGRGGIEIQQQFAVADAKYKEVQEDIRNIISANLDDLKKLEEWMDACLKAQQIVEEQKRRIDILELDSNRVNEQVSVEIQRLKTQFLDKLNELTPLPDILQATKLKLQEAQYKQSVAKENNDKLEADLEMNSDQITALAKEIEQMNNEVGRDVSDKEILLNKKSDLIKSIAQLKEANFEVKGNLDGMTSIVEKAEGMAHENILKVSLLATELERLREASADKLAKIKERCDIIRENMQNEISDLERQLVVSRAQTSTAQKDRDEIRQKMQEQINILDDNFEHAQEHIRNVQGHINFFKNTYNTVIPVDSDEVQQDSCRCGCNS